MLPTHFFSGPNSICLKQKLLKYFYFNINILNQLTVLYSKFMLYKAVNFLKMNCKINLFYSVIPWEFHSEVLIILFTHLYLF